MADSSMTGSQHRGNRGVMLLLSYLPFLPFGIIPLLLEREDADLQWHAKHGIVLSVADVLVLLACLVIGLLFGALTALIGCVVWLLPTVIVFLALVTLHAVAFVKALHGRRLVVPFVTDYVQKF